MNLKNLFFAVLFFLTLLACQISPKKLSERSDHIENENLEGIVFQCNILELQKIQSELDLYFDNLNISKDHYKSYLNFANHTLNYTLKTPINDTKTTDFYKRPEYKIKPDVLKLPLKNENFRTIKTVSKKEIALALMQHGRKTEFKNEFCQSEALIDHIGIRQNTVAWAEKLSWIWPDGEPAFWNKKYWLKGDPISKEPLHVMINDMFINQKKYSFGCYTATKAVMIQGILDYYARVQKNEKNLIFIEKQLMIDNDPLVDIEPGKMWSFEKDFDQNKMNIDGKILQIQYKIAAGNVVPGDWLYLLNTDEKTCEKTGYEGSNAIYLGQNRLDDYYADHNHSYQFDEKMDEVYQWRNGVFSRSRHKDKIKLLNEEQKQKLYNTPAQGGLMLDLRTFHKIYPR